MWYKTVVILSQEGDDYSRQYNAYFPTREAALEVMMRERDAGHVAFVEEVDEEQIKKRGIQESRQDDPTRGEGSVG